MAENHSPTGASGIPGPEARKWLQKDSQYLSPSYSRPYPCVIERG